MSEQKKVDVELDFSYASRVEFSDDGKAIIRLIDPVGDLCALRLPRETATRLYDLLGEALAPGKVDSER
ncbi:MAG: hypothetical protein KIT73_19235 [Burkholderiales bacterium]|nr:hypothetical protein [Burkholderiales bacterium]